MGRHPIPAKSTEYPRFCVISLKEIKEHPAVCKKLQERASEPFAGLREVSDELINDLFAFPRIAVVPIPGEPGYWCWVGVRVYRRLVESGRCGKVAVLNYGPGVPEESIVDQAVKDWDYWPAIQGKSAKSDRATAQDWETATKYICRPVASGNRRPSGRKLYASLRGLGLRPNRTDKEIKASDNTNNSGALNDDEEQGSEN